MEDRGLIADLLHDMDYENHPSEQNHPFVAIKYLRQYTNVDQQILHAILVLAMYNTAA